MVELQRLTGMRPGEVCRMRLAEVDRSGAVWAYRPEQHKTKHHEKERVVMIGPKGQKVILGFLADGVVEPSAPMFSPVRARDERFAAMRAKRKTKVPPSQLDRRVEKPRRQPAAEYRPHAYAHAIEDACDRAFPLPRHLAKQAGETAKQWWIRLVTAERAEVRDWRRSHRWHPNQLRHTYASEVRKEYGLEAAQCVLGHSRADVTQIYAERNESLAVQVAAKIG
jgi:integrase